MFVIIVICSPNKARLKISRPVRCMKDLNIIVNFLLLLTTFEALSIFSYLSTRFSDCNEWSSELDPEGELHSEDKLDP